MFYRYFVFGSLALFSLLFLSYSSAQSVSLTPFIQAVDDLQKQGLLDGEILVVQGEEVLYHKRSQDLDHFKEPKFMIGSISKQFFAVAILKALYETSEGSEEARIEQVSSQLHVPISLYLDESAPIWAGRMPAWADQVSLHHLLSHTSGLPNYTAFIKDFSVPQSSAAIIQMIEDKELLFSPGTKYSYCNTGYLIIAEILEALTRKTAAQSLQEMLFDPIGMVSTKNPSQGRWDQLLLEDDYLNLVPQWRFDPRGDQMTLYPETLFWDMSLAKGAGSMISTAPDLLKWNQALHKERSVLPEGLYQLFIQENLEGYGYGIGVEESAFGKILGHSGEIGSYRSLLIYSPEFDLSMILLCHISKDDALLTEEFKALLLDLEGTIEDASLRTDRALQILSEKYPSQRGFDKVVEFFNKI